MSSTPLTNTGGTITSIVLGIDGATFDLFGDWLDDLPTISSIIERGVSSRMDSVTPPVTSPAWRCYATGKQPSTIGTYWWRQLDRKAKKFIGVDQVPLASKTYWEYLSDNDNTVAIMGVPLNIPPREVNGYLVTGGPYADTENYTYPSTLQDTLEREFDYQLHPSTDPASVDDPSNEAIVHDLEQMIHQRFNVAEWFLDEKSPDFLNLSLFYINHLQHMAWKSNGVKHLWQVIDQRLGQLFDKNTDIFIHSDHGLHKIDRVFYLNAWLAENDYLVVREDDDTSNVGKLVVDHANDIIERFGVKPLVMGLLPNSVKDRLRDYSSERIIDTTDFETRIDFTRSRAVGLPHGIVYVLDDQATRKELQEELQSVCDPETGMYLSNNVVAAEDIFPSPLPKDAPDLFIRYANGIEVKDINTDDESKIFGDRVKFLADNHPEGILLAAGPNVTSNDGTLDAPRLIDIAPSILHLLDVPVPDDMDGKVLSGLFADGTDPASRPVESQSGSTVGEQMVATDNDEMKERLQDLGYLE